MNDKLELDIPLALPEVPDAADACVGRLVSTLSAKPGVERAHVLAATADVPAKLCIHFDPAMLPLPRVRDMVRAAGAEISGRYGHLPQGRVQVADRKLIPLHLVRPQAVHSRSLSILSRGNAVRHVSEVGGGSNGERPMHHQMSSA